jgi:hypothetical protein
MMDPTGTNLRREERGEREEEGEEEGRGLY